jgi:S-adenosyl-L-methionine hydrolase (adenosine-forming)
MSGPDIITFISDFGWAGGYVAACEATVITIRPQARVFHISHDVPAGDVPAGALTLKRVAPLCSPAVHLAVIDPGVGTARRPLALTSGRGDVLVGPDNGLLLDAADALGGLSAAWLLDPVRVRGKARLQVEGVSSTFHGRDVFAPAAALLAATGDPSPLGSPLDPAVLVRLTPPLAESTTDGAIAEVVEIDRFGNVGLALRFSQLAPQEGDFRVEIVGEGLPEWRARVVQTYGELRPGELGLYCDSWGQAALTLNAASAAQLLSLERGVKVRLTTVQDPAPDQRPA